MILTLERRKFNAELLLPAIYIEISQIQIGMNNCFEWYFIIKSRTKVIETVLRRLIHAQNQINHCMNTCGAAFNSLADIHVSIPCK